MKRLKNKILSMEFDTTAYNAMYGGRMTIVCPAHPTMEPYIDYSLIYYNESVAFEITTTHKPAQDKPMVVIGIPCAAFGIDIPDRSTESAEADFCLRTFKKYIPYFHSPQSGNNAELFIPTAFPPIPKGAARKGLRFRIWDSLLSVMKRLTCADFTIWFFHVSLICLVFMLRYLEVSNNDRKIDIERKIGDLYARIDEKGIDFLYSAFFTTCKRFLDLSRKQELTAPINRMRKINMVKDGGVI